MSSAGDGRWRRAGNQQQQSQTQTQTQSQSSSRERANRQSGGGNAWAQKENKPKPSNATTTPQKSAQPSVNASPTIAAQDAHVPVKNFNAVETKQYLKKSYQDAIKAAGDEKKLLWHPQDGTAAPKPAWGTPTNRMAGNRDFWALLRREVSQAEQSKPTSS